MIQNRLGRVGEAIQTLKQIDLHESDVGPAALGVRSDWLAQTGHSEQAIAGYQLLLKHFPEATTAHRQLAALLNSLGRRHEAAQHLRNLVLLGDVRQTELASLLAIQDPSLTSTVGLSTEPVQRPVTWTGPIARAQILMASHKPHLAIDLLSEVINNSETAASAESGWNAALALMGRATVEANDEQTLRIWWAHLNQDQLLLSDHWFALSKLAHDDLRDTNLAISLMAEAILRDPTDRVALGLLANWMNETQQYEIERKITQRMERLKRTVILGNRIGDRGSESSEKTAGLIINLADHLDHVGRALEANAWRMIATMRDASVDQATVDSLRHRYQALRATGTGFPTATVSTFGLRSDDPIATHQQAVERIAAIIGEFKPIDTGSEGHVDTSEKFAAVVRFVDKARERHLHFRYKNASPPLPRDLQIFQQFGGGVCALDFDHDGWVDLFFGQGGCEPSRNAPAPASSETSNRLFRSAAGMFKDCSKPSGIEDGYFTMAVASGDLNQDGWPDLLVCNFGHNECLINNTDGTFSRAEFPAWTNDRAWSAGGAVADLTGNGIPDIVEIRYLDDPRVFESLPISEHGRAIDYRGPESYVAAHDVLHLQSSTQQWREEVFHREEIPAPSLGVVVGDFDNQVGNEIFIANDTKPNRLWKREPTSLRVGSTGGDAYEWIDLAKIRGCAYSSLGGSGASMGVAAADFDRNNRIDFHVTNFLNEPAHLYLQGADGVFNDLVAASGLASESIPVLGFGTVALDFDNDGDEDLAVLNGHIEDLSHLGIAHKMPAQLFCQEHARFEMVATAGDWAKPSIGRGLIRTDLNRDGLVDMVAMFQDRPAALLENQTINQRNGGWLQVQLTGIDSERSAVGARVLVECGGTNQTRWLTSGDGYACQHESALFFGGFPKGEGLQLTVYWPSGHQDSFKNVSSDQAVLIVERQFLWAVEP
ncbi:CRTAC1 family protein [Allorhodopirellula heiligendammensis]|nr:CRTAC1 family protein [Allorhodopirellula heiligendammensis]